MNPSSPSFAPWGIAARRASLGAIWIGPALPAWRASTRPGAAPFFARVGLALQRGVCARPGALWRRGDDAAVTKRSTWGAPRRAVPGLAS